METAQHRRQRRLRTRARLTLKAWLKGHFGVPLGRLQHACHVLEAHHSSSVLPSRVRRKLQLDMAQQNNQGWWCEQCRRTVKKDANFCPSCGTGWKPDPPWQAGQAYTAQGHGTPWATGWWDQRPKSPRRKPTQSPRPRRGGGKGKGSAKDQQTAKGKHKDTQATRAEAQLTVPSMEALPVAPTGPTVAPPRKGTDEPAPPTSSAERSQFEALVKILAASSVALPEAAQQLVMEAQQTSIQSAARASHRAVADHNKAKQALTRVQQQRTGYLRSWADYMAQLTQLVEQQVQEQGRILEDLDASEVQWTVAEHQARQRLARLTRDDDSKDEEARDDHEATTSEDPVDVAVDAESKLRLATDAKKYEAKQVLSVLHKIRASAADAVGSQERDGSRTPRRTPTVDLVKEEEDGGDRPSKPAGSLAASGKAATPFGLGIQPTAPKESFQEARS